MISRSIYSFNAAKSSLLNISNLHFGGFPIWDVCCIGWEVVSGRCPSYPSLSSFIDFTPVLSLHFNHMSSSLSICIIFWHYWHVYELHSIK